VCADDDVVADIFAGDTASLFTFVIRNKVSIRKKTSAMLRESPTLRLACRPTRMSCAPAAPRHRRAALFNMSLPTAGAVLWYSGGTEVGGAAAQHHQAQL